MPPFFCAESGVRYHSPGKCIARAGSGWVCFREVLSLHTDKRDFQSLIFLCNNVKITYDRSDFTR